METYFLLQHHMFEGDYTTSKWTENIGLYSTYTEARENMIREALRVIDFPTQLTAIKETTLTYHGDNEGWFDIQPMAVNGGVQKNFLRTP